MLIWLDVYTKFYTIKTRKLNKQPYTLPVTPSSKREGFFMGFSNDFGNTSKHPSANCVVVYTTSGCTRCNMLKKWLKNKNTNFEEKNLEDSNVMTDLVMRNFVVQSAPAVEVDGEVYTDSQIFENNGLIRARFSKLFEVM